MTNEPVETILVVDDEEGIRRILTHKLSGMGYRCLEAIDTNQALETMGRENIGLVILDMKMSGQSGLEVLPEVRKRFPQTSVIMATAVSDINTVVESMKLGAYDYLTKPFNLTEVGMSAHRALEKRQLEITLNDYHEHLQQKVDEQSKIIRNAFLNAITSLAFALDAKDSYTNGHSVRVSDISVKVAKELGLPDDHVEKIRIAGLIHDIGKIGIPEMLLNKTDKLSEEEFRRIQAHSAIGEHILQPVVDDFEVLSMVRHHHERFDGRGYPDGLSRNQIPIGARILTVVDSYDAMTSDRPCRKSIPLELVAKEIERNRGTQFDPLVVDAFVKITTAMPLL